MSVLPLAVLQSVRCSSEAAVLLAVLCCLRNALSAMNSETSFFLWTLYTTVQEYKYGEENVNNKVIFTVWEKRREKIFCYEK